MAFAGIWVTIVFGAALFLFLVTDRQEFNPNNRFDINSIQNMI